MRFFAEFTLSGPRFFATLRMTRREGLRMTGKREQHDERQNGGPVLSNLNKLTYD
jgi:hypothetical protein